MKQDEKELCGWFIFCPKQQLLLVKDGDRFHIPYSVEPPVQLPADTPIHAVGQIQGHPAKACALPLEALTEQNTSFFRQTCVLRTMYFRWKNTNAPGKPLKY